MRGDDEAMRGCLWIEVLEREHAVRPLHGGRGVPPRRDLTEDATSHAPRLSRLSSKGLAQLLPEFLSGMLFRRRLPLHLRELLEEGALLRGQLGRGPDVHPHVQIAASSLADARKTLAAQPVHGAGLRAGL